MRHNKRIILLGIIFLLFAPNVRAFVQDYVPLDPGYRYQTYLNMINVKPSWSNELQVNKEIVIAVLDTGIDLDHPDLINSIWVNPGEVAGDGIDNDGNSYIDDINGWDFVDSDNSPEPNLGEEYNPTAINHGTVVAGIIAAGNNGDGIVGIAPQSKIMSLKILNEQGSGNTLLLSQAIDYAVENGADIINLSLIGDFYDEYIKDSIVKAYQQGVLVVAASGNESEDGVDLDITPRYPVCDIGGINSVLGVSAVDNGRMLADFSNYGKECIDISAPGERFYSTSYYEPTIEKFNQYYTGGWSGTSVAAPVISATAALLKQHYTTLRPFDIQTIIKETASSLQAENKYLYDDLGAGLVDIGAALNFAEKYYNEYTKIILSPEAGLEPELVVMDKEGNMESTFLAYGAGFKGGVNIAIGDVNGDGNDEIVTAPLTGGGPHVRIFNVNGEVLSEFFAFDANMTAGLNVATGDINNDGKDEIIIAPLAKAGPHVKIFSDHGELLSEFFAYEASFDGGVNLAIGDVSNNGVEEIITAPISKRVPEIRVFNSNGSIKSVFLAYGTNYTSGVNITAGDVNNDGWVEIVTVPAKDYQPDIKLFSMKGRVKGEFSSFSKYLKTGVDVLSADISGDRLDEILVLPNKGSAALLKVYDSYGLEKNSFYLRNSLDKSGYNIGILTK